MHSAGSLSAISFSQSPFFFQHYSPASQQNWKYFVIRKFARQVK